VRGSDRQNLLVDMAKAISETNTNIKHTDMGLANGKVKGRFVVDVRDLRHLESVMKAISKVKNVTRVERGQFLPDALPGIESEKGVDK
jgi:guanosine-3',5'-bis(diphosphate) 3'-pyrophosphohydrolase